MEKDFLGGEDMKVYNQEKTQILYNYDLEKGYLKSTTRQVFEPEVIGKEEKGHYHVVNQYPNGGKDVVWIVDEEGVDSKPAKMCIEEIYVYVPYTREELIEVSKNKLREKREEICFPIINRGVLWYEGLIEQQKLELKNWYKAWLDVTISMVAPMKPDWLK